MIQIKKDDTNSFTVLHVDDNETIRYAPGLTFDEMLGLVASLTMPESRRCVDWLRTQEEWDEREKRLQEHFPLGSENEG